MDLKPVLENARTVAIVGCSDNPARPSHRITRYLQQAGYRIIPVNPGHDRLHGELCYARLQEVPADPPIDLVNIFRHPRFTAGVVKDAIERVRETKERPVIWTQLGVSSPEAQRLAEDADLPYVKDRCILVEHARLM